MVDDENFFKQQTEASKIKAEIVSKYCSAWANVMAGQDNEKIAYLDLFSGPGRYDDGNPSTPILILENTLTRSNSKVLDKLVLIFNDSDPDFVKKLENEILMHDQIQKLRHKPGVFNLEINESIVDLYKDTAQVPTLSFVDPWGYKGLSLPLIRALAKDWGSDSIFFFNYLRINAGIENPALERPIVELFTADVVNELRQELEGQPPEIREKIILKKVENVFNNWGLEYVLTFPFKNETGTRTTHYLIFVSKHPLGYDIMKTIMGKASSYHFQEVPSFEYNPAAARKAENLLFDIETPLEDLKDMLLLDFVGRRITMGDLFTSHNIGKPFLKPNYKKALLELESEEKIETNREIRKPGKGFFPDDMIAIFPDKSRR